MTKKTDPEHEADQQNLSLLVDTLRQCFGASKARYYIAEYQDQLFIEIEGLETLSEETIAEVAEPILGELDLDFDEISLIPYAK